MLDKIQNFLSSDVCLSCEGCCRFDKEKSDWRPKVGQSEERPIMVSLSLDKKMCAQGLIEKGGYLKDKLCHGMYACTFFNPDDSTCGIYHHRPFECRLYPFVLTKLNQKQVVCVHLPCPYIQQKKEHKKYDEYAEYLKDFFQNPEIASFLEENPHLFGDYLGYEDELEWIFDVVG